MSATTITTGTNQWRPDRRGAGSARRALRLGDHLDDLRQQRVADLVGAHHKLPIG
jgi:hypothetical protein